MKTAASLLATAAVASCCCCCAVPCAAFQPPPPALGRRIATTTSPSLQTTYTTTTTTASPQSSSSSSSSSSTSLSLLSTPAAASLASLSSPLGSISVLAFVVLIHEAGHFLAARSMGIKVDEFSVGVGPRIAGFTRTVKEEGDGAGTADSEDSIEFSLRAIPLGGYVKFPENYNTTLAMIQDDEARELRREAREARREVKAQLQLAGAIEPRSAGLLSVLSLGLLGRKEREEARLREERFEVERLEAEKVAAKKNSRSWKNLFGLVPTQLGLAPIDSDSNSNSKALSTTTVPPPPEVEYYSDPNLLQNRPWTQRAIVLSGGVIFNILLAYTCYFGELTVGGGLPHPIFREGAVVSMAPRYDGPSNGILGQGDVIVGINGRPLTTTRSPTVGQSQEAISDFIATIRHTTPGESLRLSVIQAAKSPSGSKNADASAATSTPSAATASAASSPVDVVVQPKRTMDDSGNLGPQSIGVMLAPNYVRTDVIHAESVPDAIIKAGDATKEMTYQTARGIFTLIGNALSGKGTPAGQAVSGPIGLIKAGSDVVSSGGTSAVIGFAAAISVNLAVVNSLPLPALDGGQLAFVLAEGVTGRKVDQRRQEEINAVALFLLLALSFGTAVGDVGNIVKK